MTLASVPGKLCDAADWFDAEIQEVIQFELEEEPRFHRKQWEFAQIFLALRRRGLLHGGAEGLSLGGGYERVLYSIARHVKELVVTDLYAADSGWECSSTEDPEAFLRSHKPFPIDDTRLRALRMDMRSLDFPDGRFDFCYSSCAIEHIGGRDEFLRHLNEVARVLRGGGVYALTTEVSLGDEVIEDPGNYVFSLPYLADLIASSGLRAEGAFDARITPHRVNVPIPGNLENIVFTRPEVLSARLLKEAPHLHLLRGRYAFTSGLLVLTRKNGGGADHPLQASGVEASRAFLEKGTAEVRRLLETSEADLDPFAMLPGRTPDAETVFHTDYSWWGSGSRIFRVVLDVANGAAPEACEIELRLHRVRTLIPGEVERVAQDRHLLEPGGHTLLLTADVDEDWCYAVLAKRVRGTHVFTRIGVSSLPAEPAGASRGD